MGFWMLDRTEAQAARRRAEVDQSRRKEYRKRNLTVLGTALVGGAFLLFDYGAFGGACLGFAGVLLVMNHVDERLDRLEDKL
jgi:hypothetical protein